MTKNWTGRHPEPIARIYKLMKVLIILRRKISKQSEIHVIVSASYDCKNIQCCQMNNNWSIMYFTDDDIMNHIEFIM